MDSEKTTDQETRIVYKDPDFRARLGLIIGSERPYSWAKRMEIDGSTFHNMWNKGFPPGPATAKRIVDAGYNLNYVFKGIGEIKISVADADELAPMEKEESSAEYVMTKLKNATNLISDAIEEYKVDLDHHWSTLIQDLIMTHGLSDDGARRIVAALKPKRED